MQKNKRFPSRGRPRKQDEMTPFGLFLYEHLEQKSMTIKDLALKLGMQSQMSMLRRLFYGPTKVFAQINRMQLIRVLGLDLKGEQQFNRLVEEHDLQFQLIKTPEIIRSTYNTIDLVKHGEPALIQLLHAGKAEFVLHQAQEDYRRIASDPKLQSGDELATEWLLRYGKIIEQAQESMLPWHTNRVRSGNATLQMLSNDIADRRGWTETFSHEYAKLCARKAILWRENRRDNAQKNERSLAISDCYFRYALDAIRGLNIPGLELVLMCQQLHTKAIQGDLHWIQDIDMLHQTVERNPRLAMSQKAGLESIVLYFKIVGYKRFAYALRHQTDRVSEAQRRQYIQMAQSYANELGQSGYFISAWRAANIYQSDLMFREGMQEEQKALQSEEQTSLLFRVTVLEIEAWSKPNFVLEQSLLLNSQAKQLYPSVLIKISNNETFAKSIIDR